MGAALTGSSPETTQSHWWRRRLGRTPRSLPRRVPMEPSGVRNCNGRRGPMYAMLATTCGFGQSVWKGSVGAPLRWLPPTTRPCWRRPGITKGWLSRPLCDRSNGPWGSGSWRWTTPVPPESRSSIRTEVSRPWLMSSDRTLTMLFTTSGIFSGRSEAPLRPEASSVVRHLATVGVAPGTSGAWGA